MASHDEEETKDLIFSQFVSHAFPPPSEPLSPTFILPNAYWTPGDKESFFVSLARHSRWRPDIIAEDIGGGKSTADVCSYIELLEQGLVRDVRKNQHLRDTQSCARVVSEEWIGMEESMAKLLFQEEGRHQDAAAKRKRKTVLKEVKAALRREEEDVERIVSEDEQGFAADPKRRRTSSEMEERETWEERYKKRKRELAVLWKRENLLSSLEGRYLKTLESMVRDLEEEGGKPPQDDTGDDTLRGASVMAGSGLPVPFGSSGSNLMVSPRFDRLNMGAVDNSSIDPVLLALDAESNTNPVASSSRPLQSRPQDTQPYHPPTPLAHTSPGPSGTRPAHLNPSIPLPNVTNAPACTPLLDPNSQPLPSELSPASRRRIRKRLWMRQKRAALNGLPASEVCTDTRKLKPGRKGTSTTQKAKGKEKEVSTSREHQDSDAQTRNDPELNDQATDSDSRSVADGGEGGGVNTSDRTRRKKLYGSSKLEAVHVDGPFLRTEGLDLFHLGKFGGMTSLLRDIYKRPADKGDDDSNEEAAVSYSILRLLRAHIADFVTRLLARVIAQKQVEVQQKKRVKGILQTGGSLEVRAENVHEALNIMGEEISHKRFFKKLKATARSTDFANGEPSESRTRSRRAQTRKSAAASDSDESEAQPNDSESETTGDSASSSEAGSDVRVDDQDDSSFHALPLMLIPQPPSGSFWNPEVLFRGNNDDALLPEQTDEEALRKELKAERKVEDADQESDKSYEHALWTELGIERDIPRGTSRPERQKRQERPAGSKVNQSLRFRQPGGYVKSRVYIDSDEDEPVDTS